MLILRIGLFLTILTLSVTSDGLAQKKSDELVSRVDHLVYITPDLNRGIEEIEKLLGVRATPGGQHIGYGTRNALIALGPNAGGPVDVDQATITRDFPYIAELLVAKGAIVLRPNYRGSSGYGRKFRELLVRNLGISQYWDVIAGVDYLIAQGTVDPKRVGVMGWSHGGYLAAFFTTYSDRFKAVSVGAGVSDWRIFYTVGAGSAVKPDYMKANPWDDPEYYRLTSPLSYVKQAKTPTLIQHGGSDGTAPIVGAYELNRALKDNGAPVKMIVYNGAGHLPSGLKQTRFVIEHNYEWFSQWIWKETQDDN
jgi:dipeptidyl aminopeptidase/acylaminoacyl peptidase